MTKPMSMDERLDARERSIFRANDRFIDRMGRRWDAAERMIGELSSGKHYVFPIGGKYREGSRADLVDFLIRNNYA